MDHFILAQDFLQTVLSDVILAKLFIKGHVSKTIALLKKTFTLVVFVRIYMINLIFLNRQTTYF